MPIGTNTKRLVPIGILLNPLLAILTANTSFWQKQSLVLYIAKILIHKTHLPYKITLYFSVYNSYQFVDNYSLYTPLSTNLNLYTVDMFKCISSWNTAAIIIHLSTKILQKLWISVDNFVEMFIHLCNCG